MKNCKLSSLNKNIYDVFGHEEKIRICESCKHLVFRDGILTCEKMEISEGHKNENKND